MLYLVPTPIGNLRDITLRALDTLKEADLIVCEDTRHTGILLKHFSIAGPDGGTPPLLSFHEYSGASRVEEILRQLKEGKRVALVSDGGMPVISDPGFEIVREAIRNGIQVEALPGPSAVVTALAASGLAPDSFSFFGFLPQKSAARKKRLAEFKEREETLIFYESPYRLLQVLQDMREVWGDREAVVAREISKKFEEYSRGYLSKLVEKFSKKKVLGEIVILVSGQGRKEVLSHE